MSKVLTHTIVGRQFTTEQEAKDQFWRNMEPVKDDYIIEVIHPIKYDPAGGWTINYTALEVAAPCEECVIGAPAERPPMISTVPGKFFVMLGRLDPEEVVAFINQSEGRRVYVQIEVME